MLCSGKKVAIVGVDFLKTIAACAGQVNRIHCSKKDVVRQCFRVIAGESEKLRSYRNPLPHAVSFVQFEIFNYFPRFNGSQIAFADVAM